MIKYVVVYAKITPFYLIYSVPPAIKLDAAFIFKSATASLLK